MYLPLNSHPANRALRLGNLFTLSALLIIGAFPAGAAQRVWVGRANNNLWTASANWSPASRPLQGDDLVFPANASRLDAQNDIAGLTLRSIQFVRTSQDAIGAQGNRFNIRGQGLSVSNGIAVGSGVEANVFMAVESLRNQTFRSTGTGGEGDTSRLNFNASINLGRTQLTLDAAAGDLIAFLADVSGQGGFRKIGPGTALLGAPNFFSGEVLVEQGDLKPTTPTSLGTPAAGTRVKGTGRVVLDGGLMVSGETLIIEESAPGALTSVSGINSWEGPIQLLQQGGIHVDDGRLVLAAPSLPGARTALAEGPGGLSKTGHGVLEFRGTLANRYQGPTLVLEGFLESLLTTGPGIPGDAVVGDGTTNRLPGASVLAAIYSLASGQFANLASIKVDRSGALSLGRTGTDPAVIAESLRGLSGEGLVVLGAGASFRVAPVGASSFFGRMNGDGHLTKSGPGTLNLHGGVNTLSGGVTVEEGTFGIFGTLDESVINVLSGARLEGDGEVAGVSVATGGEIAPLSGQRGRLGADFNSHGAFSLAAGSVLRVDFFGPGLSQGDDIIIVDSQVSVGNAGLEPVFHYAPSEGTTVSFLRSAGFNQVQGTFTDWPDGAQRVVAGIPLRINYRGGAGGNEITLTVGAAGLRAAGHRVLGGNGNGAVEPNECNQLYLSIGNNAVTPVSIARSYLRAVTPGVVVTRPEGSFGELAGSATVEGTMPFQLSTSTELPCGTEIRLELQLATALGQTFTVPFSLPAGTDCESTGGACESCTVVAGMISAESPAYGSFLNQQSEPSTCLVQKQCPGRTTHPSLPAVRYMTHSFVNDSASEVCVTVMLSHTGACAINSRSLAASAYLNQLNPEDVCANYLGDMGAQLDGSYRPFSFRVSAGAAFEVVVTDVGGLLTGGCASYKLELFGVPCAPPSLTLAPGSEPGSVLVQWSTAYPEWLLESASALGGNPDPFSPHPVGPSIVNGKFTVANEVSGSRFFRLVK